MAQINPIKNPVGFASNVWKGGMGSGAVTGFTQGLLAMFGLHQFLARSMGGVISASMQKDALTKKVILLESTKEAVYQLMAGE